MRGSGTRTVTRIEIGLLPSNEGVDDDLKTGRPSGVRDAKDREEYKALWRDT
jgi:hypothetical protein